MRNEEKTRNMDGGGDDRVIQIGVKVKGYRSGETEDKVSSVVEQFKL